MSETSSKVPTPSLDLSDFEIVKDPAYDLVVGLNQAYREARYSLHTTQVGCSLNGVQTFNRVVETEIDGYIKTLHRHAESSAILRCARLGLPTQGATMFAPWASCMACSMDIADAGISHLVVHRTVMDKTPERWLTSVDEGLSYLYDEGVRVTVVDTVIGVKIMFDGKELVV